VREFVNAIAQIKRDSMKTSLILGTLLSTLIVNAVSATPKAIKFKLKNSLTSGYRVMAVSPDGSKAKTGSVTGKNVQIAPPTSTALIYLLDGNNNVAYQVVNKYCSGKDKSNCKRNNLVNTVFKAGSDLGTLKTLDGALLGTLNGARYSKSVVGSITANATNWIPTGIASHGLAARTVAASAAHARQIVILAAAGDADNDGLVDPVDSDDDGDGTLDNYDEDDSDRAAVGEFHIFSNFKLDIDQSLNYNTTGLDTARIDSALRSTQSLAIEVAAPNGTDVELDCGDLGYCSSGGTGTSQSGAFPDLSDPDSDGLGLITRGPTGDFQLQTHATSSSIGAGDTYIQRFTSNGESSEIPGMLNFMFVSNPGLSTVGINNDAPVNLDYTANPMIGSRNNCISLPSSGNVSVTLTGWRPQRPGDSSIGEGEYVDIGGSFISIDIPNGPSVEGAGGQGPGNCSAASYSTTDSNIGSDGNGLVDTTSDRDVDPDNKFSFKVNLSQCLNDAQGGPISWNSGEKLFLDVQFRSSAGDNAAQKFCLVRAN